MFEELDEIIKSGGSVEACAEFCEFATRQKLRHWVMGGFPSSENKRDHVLQKLCDYGAKHGVHYTVESLRAASNAYKFRLRAAHKNINQAC